MDGRLATLKRKINGGNGALRPVLTMLNGDNSWLISLPRPLPDRQASGRAFYHLVADAWLKGPAITTSAWLISIARQEPAVLGDGESIASWIHDIEDVAIAAGLAPALTSSSRTGRPGIDGILADATADDHMNKETLVTFDAAIPVFGPADVAAAVKGWKHFDIVTAIKDITAADADWRQLHPGGPLPDWLHIFRLPGGNILNFATAIVSSLDEHTHEAIVLSPHGIHADQPSVQTLAQSAKPPITTLAMMHLTKNSYLFGYQTTMGVKGGLALERELKPKYWVKTGDAVLDYKGVVLWGVKDVWPTLDWALEDEKTSRPEAAKEDLGRPNLIGVGNGGCFVLE